MKVYRDVFQKEFNLGFHQPKKDICKDCVAFDGLSTVEKGLVQQEHDNHVPFKESCWKKTKVYRDVFQKEFNLGFHQPKKDLCKDCVAFDCLSTVEKGLVQQEHDNHVSLKESCRKEKALNKMRADESDKAFHSVTFDLQQVLNYSNRECFLPVLQAETGHIQLDLL